MNDALIQFQALLPPALRHAPWLSGLALRQHDLPARSTLYRAGQPTRRLYFVAKGWVGSAVSLTDSAKPFTSLRIRGDVVGLNCLDGRKAVEDVSTVTGSELISVPCSEFAEAMTQDPVLVGFVHGELVRDISSLQLMNAIIGRLTAPDRLACFLYIMMHRARRTFHGRLDTLNLPLTQDEIGQFLGLTNVSVNRAFRRLENEQLIRTGRQSVTFVNEKRFAARLHFEEWSDLVDRIVDR